ncbi:MAG: c-type cytochrome [Gemmatimonadota bacterium]|nr:c-type cytochrome [Gemmatimonadota bacterium]
MVETKIRWPAGLALALVFGAAACGGDANGNAAQEAAQDAAQGVADVAADVQEAAAGIAEAAPQELPEGVTAEMVAKGKTIYAGAGICSSCHGPAGAGIPNLGANLTDAEWLHSDGSYDGIVKTVTAGVTAQASSSGVPMPAKGGTNISEDDVKAVAAYVWTLGHGGE